VSWRPIKRHPPLSGRQQQEIAAKIGPVVDPDLVQLGYAATMVWLLGHVWHVHVLDPRGSPSAGGDGHVLNGRQLTGGCIAVEWFQIGSLGGRNVD
jgi:hypothetical protein